VDFQDQQRELTFTSTGSVRLAWNAARFGFHHPAWADPGQPSAEPWHWEG
jgi:hypothetical protein